MVPTDRNTQRSHIAQPATHMSSNFRGCYPLLGLVASTVNRNLSAEVSQGKPEDLGPPGMVTDLQVWCVPAGMELSWYLGYPFWLV